MSDTMISVRSLLAPLGLALVLGRGCAPVEAPQGPGLVVAAPVLAPAPSAAEPELDAGQARARADALVQTHHRGEYGNDEAARRRAAGLGLDEAVARRGLAGL